MAENRIEGTVKRIGRRTTEIGTKVTVEDIHEINVHPAESEKSDFNLDPSKYVERLLKQEGHPVQRVIIPKGADIVAHPDYWFHITDDERHPALRCVWVWIEEGPGPSPYVRDLIRP